MINRTNLQQKKSIGKSYNRDDFHHYLLQKQLFLSSFKSSCNRELLVFIFNIVYFQKN